jgi:hypothetical protein
LLSKCEFYWYSLSLNALQRFGYGAYPEGYAL